MALLQSALWLCLMPRCCLTVGASIWSCYPKKQRSPWEEVQALRATRLEFFAAQLGVLGRTTRSSCVFPSLHNRAVWKLQMEAQERLALFASYVMTHLVAFSIQPT